MWTRQRPRWICSVQLPDLAIDRLDSDRRSDCGVARVWLLIAGVLLSGCGTLNPTKFEAQNVEGTLDPCRAECDGDEACVAMCNRRIDCLTKFYLPYSVLAADVYRTRGAAIERLQLMSEESLRKLTGGKDLTAERLENLYKLYKDARKSHCQSKRREGDNSVGDSAHNRMCNEMDQKKEIPPDRILQIFNSGNERYEDKVPKEPQQCIDEGEEARPWVPVTEVTRQWGWTRIKHFDKYATTRGWLVFVPDLAIEVWRRHRKNHEDDEYALVFRGTAGVGGWFSNFRVLTALFGFFWDQYGQAEMSAKRIVDQIFMSELLEAARKDPNNPMQHFKLPLITLVGHSLGAGLAKYVYFKLPEATRVVGFNPSPIDGSRMLVDLSERTSIMENRGDDPDPAPYSCEDQAQPVPGDDKDKPTMFLLYEKGEIVTRVSPCVSGAQWGDEGGPVSVCQSVDLNEGSSLYKHGMNILACKLALRHFKVGSERIEASRSNTDTDGSNLPD